MGLQIPSAYRKRAQVLALLCGRMGSLYIYRCVNKTVVARIHLQFIVVTFVDNNDTFHGNGWTEYLAETGVNHFCILRS